MQRKFLALAVLASTLVLAACGEEEPLEFGLEIESPATGSQTARFPVGVIRGRSTDAARLRLSLTAGERNWGFDLRPGTVLLFDMGEAPPAPVVLPGTAERPSKEENLAALNERLASVAETAVMRVHDTRSTFLVDLPPGREGKIGSVVQAAASTTILGFFIEVLPMERYGRERQAPRLEDEASYPWPRSIDAFRTYKEAEVEVYLAARKAGRPYEPTEPGFFVLPRSGGEARDVFDFAVLELPADPSHRIGGEALANARQAKDPNTGEPVVLYDVKEPYQAAFGAWTAANVGLPMAIVLDWEFRSAPYINGRLESSVQITLGTEPWAVLEIVARELAKGLSSQGSVAVASLVAAATWRRDGAFEILRPLDEQVENVVALEATGHEPGEKVRLERVLTREPGAASDGKTAADARLAEVRLGALRREAAAKALEPVAEGAARRLGEIATDRIDAAHLLARLDPASETAYRALAHLLEGDHAETREEAAETLGEMRPSPGPVDALLAAVQRGDEVSHAAAEALAHHATSVDAAFDGLLALASAGELAVRAPARNALSSLSEEFEERLLVVARGPDPAHRAAAVDALAVCYLEGAAATKRIALLVEATRDEDARVRAVAVSGLTVQRNMHEEGLLAHLGSLTALLDDEDERVRQHVALLLGDMGASAVPGALEVLSTGSPAGRAAALYVLWGAEAAGPEVVAAIETALDDVSLLVRVMAAGGLHRHKGELRHLVPIIEEASETDDEKVRLTAVSVLFMLATDEQEDAPFVLPSLLERFLDDELEDIRVYAAVALEGIGAMTDRAHEILDTVKADKDHPMRGFTTRR